MTRRMLAFVAIFIIVWISVLFPSSNVASASSVSPPSVDLTQLQRTCAVLAIHLNGAQHTITCVHKDPPSQNHALSQGPCIPFVTTMQIFNYAYNATLCFEGDGYLGVRIYQVNELDDTSNGFAWVKWYHQGSTAGHYCAIFPSDAGYWGDSTDVTLTQIDIGNPRSPSDPYCPHR